MTMRAAATGQSFGPMWKPEWAVLVGQTQCDEVKERWEGRLREEKKEW